MKYPLGEYTKISNILLNIIVNFGKLDPKSCLNINVFY